MVEGDGVPLAAEKDTEPRQRLWGAREIRVAIIGGAFTVIAGCVVATINSYFQFEQKRMELQAQARTALIAEAMKADNLDTFIDKSTALIDMGLIDDPNGNLQRQAHLLRSKNRDSFSANTAPSSEPMWFDGDTGPSATSAAPDQAANGSEGLYFRWPVAGVVIRKFGQRDESGTPQMGIDIKVPVGTPVRASESGVVSYAGNDLRPYGNLVLIRHDSGYITTYAHLDRYIIRKGDRIASNQIIGYSGRTGDATTPSLYFEIRSTPTTPVDPMEMLAPN